MSEPFIGEIKMFGFNFAPRGWANCDGQLLSISQNTALFSLLGTTYGGDGRTTFGLPDLRGRTPTHTGNGPGLTNRPMGSRGGQERVTLTPGEMPAHTHQPNCVQPGGNTNDAVNNFWADDIGVSSGTYHTGPANALMNANALTSVGGNQSHENMQPFLTVRFCIALVGIYPSRG